MFPLPSNGFSFGYERHQIKPLNLIPFDVNVWSCDPRSHWTIKERDSFWCWPLNETVTLNSTTIEWSKSDWMSIESNGQDTNQRMDILHHKWPLPNMEHKVTPSQFQYDANPSIRWSIWNSIALNSSFNGNSLCSALCSLHVGHCVLQLRKCIYMSIQTRLEKLLFISFVWRHWQWLFVVLIRVLGRYIHPQIVCLFSHFVLHHVLDHGKSFSIQCAWR